MSDLETATTIICLAITIITTQLINTATAKHVSYHEDVYGGNGFVGQAPEGTLPGNINYGADTTDNNVGIKS